MKRPAKGTRGFIIVDPFSGGHYFRVYKDSKDLNGVREFIDYDIAAEEFEVEIVSDDITLEVSGDEGCLDYSDEVLGIGVKGDDK